MRPLSLKVKGFTSFRDEQAIDFTDLDLFVLWGPTGSGKSSLLDAMTYALFGSVERVGNQIAQLVSHGQPRLSVALEFAVGDAAYRVTRSTTHSAHSRALLERREGDEWVSYGEGADSVREVNRIVRDLIGLDYEAFTRSVILPQGKFAEFLTGDASKRREILTELLGLELFKRMSQRANEISRDAKAHLDTKSDLLEREYAGVSEDALDKAIEDHAAKVELHAAAEELAAKLAAIEKRWSGAERARKALAGCISEVHDAAEIFGDAATDLDELAKAAATSAADVATATDDLKGAHRDQAAAAKKRATAEGKWGSLEDLAGLRHKALSLEDARAEHDEALAALADATAEVADVKAAVKQAATALRSATKQADAAAGALTAAEVAHAEAHQKEVVGGLVGALKPGDPCPVCERPLESIPKATRAGIEKAKNALAAARSASLEASAALNAAETEEALVKQQLRALEENVARYKKDVTNRKGRLDLLVSEIAAVAGKTDPLGQIDKRAAELRDLIAAEESATQRALEAQRELDRRVLAASRVAGEIEKIKTRITTVPLAPICARVAEVASGVDVIDRLPDELPEAPDALGALASSMHKELSKLADELEGLQAARERELAELLDEARRSLPTGLALDVGSIADVVANARATATQLAGDERIAKKAVQDLTQRLETKARYEAEIQAHRHEHTVYRDLGRELRSDSIVQFLQAEALVALAHAATVHLEHLSSTRYRLSYEDDRFFVIDAWNGNERRNVKTLSGGETFQASLALALALSEQVQFLAVTERGRLDSLFLDEGFGTLDAETLDVVVDAIEQLGGDGRLVGVITHVPELADRLPVRFEVTKSQRGSTLKRANHELAVAPNG
ncbi:MAG: SMC family ATPase [Actinomycetota bacterium]|nr:SMC family ATPase [Actinomycetota bacterium]